MLLAAIQESNTEHFSHIKHVTITQQRISVISHGRYEVSWDFMNHSLLLSIIFSSWNIRVVLRLNFLKCSRLNQFLFVHDRVFFSHFYHFSFPHSLFFSCDINRMWRAINSIKNHKKIIKKMIECLLKSNSVNKHEVKEDERVQCKFSLFPVKVSILWECFCGVWLISQKLIKLLITWNLF